jgi:hypothetical protein
MPLKIGLQWYNSSTDLTHEQKVKRAIQRHVERLGTHPNVIYVWPDYDGPGTLHGLQVRKSGHMHKNNYWLTIDPDLPQIETEDAPQAIHPADKQISLFDREVLQ